ncbi:MAG: hypothetical protein K8U03_23025 [Planctomycetia bacterium]|nr:hypothetical protein [Planctomycetia bacterium]
MLRFRWVVVCALVLGTPAYGQSTATKPAPAANQAAANQAAAKQDSAKHDAGLRVFVCGHSFHVFLARHITEMAREAGLVGHQTVGAQMLGGSSVTQHWYLPDEKNQVKEALTAGKVDVLTLAPNWFVPDAAIDKFTELALKHNPETRVVVQLSWAAYDSDGIKPRITDNLQRDTKTPADIAHLLDVFYAILEKQVSDINAKHQREVVALAPVGTAVVRLREKVIAGEAPGIKKQSELFTDPIGHATMPVIALCCYVNYAVIYGRSPVGLKTFINQKDPNSAKLQRMLQEIAWGTVTSYGPSGVKKSESGE